MHTPPRWPDRCTMHCTHHCPDQICKAVVIQFWGNQGQMFSEVCQHTSINVTIPCPNQRCGHLHIQQWGDSNVVFRKSFFSLRFRTWRYTGGVWEMDSVPFEIWLFWDIQMWNLKLKLNFFLFKNILNTCNSIKSNNMFRYCIVYLD